MTRAGDDVHVNLSLCAVLKDRAGSYEGDLEVADGTTLADALGGVDLPSELPWITCVNGRPAPGGTALAEGDQLYVFLPVSGG